jgi:hypothetical protein
MNELRKRFLRDVKNVNAPEVLVTATQLPSGAIETAINTTKLAAKIDYIINTYDDNFALKSNPTIKIVGYMLV